MKTVPGQESGNGLVDVLYGSTSPSGKLPYTIAKQTSDYGTAPSNNDDPYTEGLFIDYRHFDQKAIAPRYEFGFGLSYTTFSYSNLTISALNTAPGSTTLAPGGQVGLWDIVATVSITITNNGTVSGAEVPQLYIGLPASAPTTPVKQLRGFDKLSLAAGQSGISTFKLRRKDLSYWDVKSQKWIMPTGVFNVMVGASSRDIRVTGSLGSSTTMSSSSVVSSAPVSSAPTSSVASAPSSISSAPVSSASSTAPAAPTSSTVVGTVPQYGQCGGQGWTGATACVAGYTCKATNQYYSQCL